MIIIKEVMYAMKIVGTPEEIKWIKDSLMNNCTLCPFMVQCNKDAKEDAEKYGEVRKSCEEYLEDGIEIIVEQ